MTVNDIAMKNQNILQKPAKEGCFSSKKPDKLSRKETGRHRQLVNQK